MNDMIPYACTDKQRGSGEKLVALFLWGSRVDDMSERKRAG